MGSAFANVIFDRDSHMYRIGDMPLTSVTTVIKEITPPFDRERISKRCAERDGVTVDAILALWEAKSSAAKARGTAVHSAIEDYIQGREDAVVAACNELPEIDAFKLCWRKLQTEFKAEIVRQELVVGDLELGVAGCVDAVIRLWLNGGWMYAVFDFKTGEEFKTSNRFEKLLPPFADLDACEMHCYSLQTSTYRLIMERAAPAMAFTDSYLVYLRRDGQPYVYRARDYRERCRTWLTERKKRLDVERGVTCSREVVAETAT